MIDSATDTATLAVVREMIKTSIENGQSLIIEGCYIPFDWSKDFDNEYLTHIKYYCLIMSQEYIKNHFADIREYSNVIEKRLSDEFSMETTLEENARFLKLAQKYNVNYILINGEYEIEID